MTDNQQPNHGDTLPPAMQRLHRRLLEDGAAWRAESPSSASFRRRVQEFGRAPAAQARQMGLLEREMRDSEHMTLDHRSIPPAPSMGGAPNGGAKPKRGLIRGIIGIAATLVIAGLFAVAFQVLPVNRTPNRPPANHPSAGKWDQIGQFPARNDERVVAAPSDPYVVYRINTKTFAMERSVEGGAKWEAVTLPSEVTQSPMKSSAAIDVNPVDARIVYLTAFGKSSPGSCPQPFEAGGQGNHPYVCSLQYVSIDSGKTWRNLQLPSNGRLTGMLSQMLGAPHAPLLAQDHRVYSLMTIDAYAGTYRLVESGNGVTWQTADADLAAAGLRIADYLASPTGSTVWAALSDGSLWRSDNAGQNWTRVGALPQEQYPRTSELAATRIVDGKPILYIKIGSPPFGDIAPDDVRVSMDGGKTWQKSPASGVPDGQHAARYSAMTRSDGTLVMLFRTSQPNIAFDEGILRNAAFYAWKPGATSWTRLTSTFDAEAVQQTWITPANSAKPLEMIWTVIYRDTNLTYQGNDSYVRDGTYTITGFGLKP